jgi:tetratricopeptide (TPR) repeat protein
VLVDQGKLDEALKAYSDSLAICQRLAAANPSNTDRQRDLSLSFDNVAKVLTDLGKLDEALKAYRDRLAVAERLAAADRSNTEWQRDLSISYDKVGDVLKAQNKLDEALKAYRDELAIAEQLAAADRSNTEWQNDFQYSIGNIGGLAFEFVLARNFVRALEAADLVISLAPDQIWLYTNRAHALMFLGRIDEARALYLKYRGQQNVDGEKSWEARILEDFAEFQKVGLAHPLMQEIEKQFTGT